jgi:hypothetical protein
MVGIAYCSFSYWTIQNKAGINVCSVKTVWSVRRDTMLSREWCQLWRIMVPLNISAKQTFCWNLTRNSGWAGCGVRTRTCAVCDMLFPRLTSDVEIRSFWLNAVKGMASTENAEAANNSAAQEALTGRLMSSVTTAA